MTGDCYYGECAADEGRVRLPGRRLSLLAMVAIMGTQGDRADAMDGAPSPDCEAAGAEVLQPAISDTQACDTFTAALHEALSEHGAQNSDLANVAVSLSFRPNGVARADVARGGEHLFDTNFAMMDRPMDHRAIRQLARQVAERLTQGSRADG